MYYNAIFTLPKIILNNFHCMWYFIIQYVIRFAAQSEMISACSLMVPFIQELHVHFFK